MFSAMKYYSVCAVDNMDCEEGSQEMVTHQSIECLRLFHSYKSETRDVIKFPLWLGCSSAGACWTSLGGESVENRQIYICEGRECGRFLCIASLKPWTESSALH